MSFLGRLFGLGSLDEATAKRVREVVAEGATVLDVRSKREFRGGHVDGALNVPLAQLGRTLPRIPKERPVVLYCASGGRSRVAAGMLRRAGYPEVLDVGRMAWWPT